MASKIEFQTIDEGFPVAGVDNNSQGFRDNFATIKNSFEDAKSEITDLQDNAARIDEDNNFNGVTLSDLTLKQAAFEAITQGTQTNVDGSADVEISFETAHYHKNTIAAASATLKLVGWPDSSFGEKYAKMTVELVGDSNVESTGPYTVSFIGEVSPREMKIETDSVLTRLSPTEVSIEISSSVVSRVIEFWSYNNGENIFVKHIGDFE